MPGRGVGRTKARLGEFFGVKWRGFFRFIGIKLFLMVRGRTLMLELKSSGIECGIGYLQKLIGSYFPFFNGIQTLSGVSNICK